MEVVRISKKGRALLANKPLADKVGAAVMKYGKELFMYGKTITVTYKGVSVRIRSTTSIHQSKIGR